MSVQIPDNILIIGKYSFSGIVSTVFEIGNTVTKIDTLAFEGAIIPSLKLNSNLVELATNAFYNAKITTLIIDNQIIISNLTNENYSEGITTDIEISKIYVLSSLNNTNATYLSTNYTQQETSDKTGYDMLHLYYLKKITHIFLKFLCQL